jgi:pimeloyl-ACP methyl ester carboxylesterase
MVTMYQITLRGITFRYEEKGEKPKPSVVLIHGSASDHRTWEPQLEKFSEKYRVFAYSRRSHYPNPYTEYGSGYSVQVESDDLAALIEGLGLAQSPVHLVGWSYGAFIAAVTAQKYPQLVRSLVLAEPPIMSFLTANPTTTPLYSDYTSKVSTIRQFLSLGRDREAVECFIDGVSGTGAFRHTPPEQQQRMIQNARTLYELTTAQRDPFTCADAKSIDAPTLLVSGEESPLFLKKITAALANCLTEQESVVIKNAGHVMHRQNVLEYNKAVLGFIDGQ